MSDERRCRICGEGNVAMLEEHHIIPKRYGGSDTDDNLVTLCANCHKVIETVYDNEVWERINLTPAWGVDGPTTREHIWKEGTLVSKLEEFKYGVERKHLQNSVAWDDYKNADYTDCDDQRTAFMLGQYQAFNSLQESLLTGGSDFTLTDESVDEISIKKDNPKKMRDATREKLDRYGANGDA